MASLEALSDAEWLLAAKEALQLAAGELSFLAVRPAPVSADGDGVLNGFVGDTMRVRVAVQRLAASDDVVLPEEEVAMFLKVVPEGNVAREALALGTHAFLKESGLYRKLSNRLKSALGGGVTPWAPRLLFAKNTGLLVFEDITSQGFKTLGGRVSLDFDHCALALETVARLHAASLALEESDRRGRHLSPWRLGERFPDLLEEIMFTETFENHMSKFIKASVTSMQALAELMPEYKNSPRFEEILKKLESVPKISWDIVKPSEEFRNVLCHGDLWVNNIMFKYDASGKVSEARLVDFQLIRYSPPASDVQSLLHLSCRWPLRRERGAELRDRYYSAFSSALQEAGFKAEELLPRAEFLRSCDRYATFGRIITAAYMASDLLPSEILLPVMSSGEDYDKFLTSDRSAFVREAFPKDAYYRHRLREIMAELVEGLILPDKPLP